MGPYLQNECVAMNQDTKCKKEFEVKNTRKRSPKKKRKKGGWRIVGGEEAKKSMPWMVTSSSDCSYRCIFHLSFPTHLFVLQDSVPVQLNRVDFVSLINPSTKTGSESYSPNRHRFGMLH